MVPSLGRGAIDVDGVAMGCLDQARQFNCDRLPLPALLCPQPALLPMPAMHRLLAMVVLLALSAAALAVKREIGAAAAASMHCTPLSPLCTSPPASGHAHAASGPQAQTAAASRRCAASQEAGLTAGDRLGRSPCVAALHACRQPCTYSPPLLSVSSLVACCSRHPSPLARARSLSSAWTRGLRCSPPVLMRCRRPGLRSVLALETESLWGAKQLQWTRRSLMPSSPTPRMTPRQRKRLSGGTRSVFGMDGDCHWAARQNSLLVCVALCSPQPVTPQLCCASLCFPAQLLQGCHAVQRRQVLLQCQRAGACQKVSRDGRTKRMSWGGRCLSASSAQSMPAILLQLLNLFSVTKGARGVGSKEVLRPCAKGAAHRKTCPHTPPLHAKTGPTVPFLPFGGGPGDDTLSSACDLTFTKIRVCLPGIAHPLTLPCPEHATQFH